MGEANAFFGGGAATISQIRGSRPPALKVLKSFAVYDTTRRNHPPSEPPMSERHHLLRLWILGTMILMITFGTLTGSLVRRWQDDPVLPENTALVLVAGLMTVGLIGVWFRNGRRLWLAVKAR